MILKAIKIVPFLLASVNSSNFYTENKKQASNDVNFTMDLDEQISTGKTLLIDTDYRYHTGKKTYTNSNNYMMAFVNSNIETPFTTTNNLNYINTYTSYNFYDNCNSVTAIQINPYQKTINDSITFRYRFNMRNNTNNSNQITLRADIYTSQDQTWANYIEQANWGQNVSFNADTIAAITNANQGFIYTQQTFETILTPTSTTSGYNQDISYTIYIDPNQTNYIYIHEYLLTSTQEQYEIGQNNEWAIIGNVTITGTYTPGVTGYEVVDIPGIMWEVLTMPFSFISVAFNLTLFPNTPYQVNISNLFLSILAILIFVYLINKLVLRR